MEPEFALAEGADGLSVDLDVADEQHLFVVLTNSLGAAAQLLGRLPAVAELAEIGREPKLLLLGDALAAKDQHQMLAPRLFDRAHRRLGQLLGQIDALDRGAAGGRQRRDLYVDDIVHGTIPPPMKTPFLASACRLCLMP